MNYYKILGLKENATGEEIKRAYRRLAKKYHPDVNKSHDAQQKFVEIAEAYEILTNPTVSIKTKTGKTTYYQQSSYYNSAQKTYEEQLREQQEAERRKKKRDKRAYEKLVREIKYLKEVRLFNLALFYHLLRNNGAMLLGILLIVIPVVISLFTEIWLIIISSPFIVTGIWIINFVTKNSKENAEFQHFDFSHWNLKNLLNHKFESTKNEHCWFTKNNIANAKPYRYLLYKVKQKEIHSAVKKHKLLSYGSKLRRVNIPRSKKAWTVHQAATFIKISAILTSIFYLNLPSLLWEIIIGTFVGGIISSSMFLITRVRSNIWHLVNISNILRLAVFIYIVFSYTVLIPNTSVYIPEFPYAQLLLSILMLEMFLYMIVNSFPASKFNAPIFKIYPKAASLYSDGFRIGNGFAVLTYFYPLMKWFF